MLGREDIAALIPHRGAMCLLEELLEWDAEHVLAATATHRARDNPLRSGDRLRALHLAEYGAQATALHGGLVANAAGERAKPGMLVSLRDVQLHRLYVDDVPGMLHVEARRVLSGPASWQYSFTVRHAEELLASGRVAIMARAPL